MAAVPTKPKMRPPFLNALGMARMPDPRLLFIKCNRAPLSLEREGKNKTGQKHISRYYFCRRRTMYRHYGGTIKKKKLYIYIKHIYLYVKINDRSSVDEGRKKSRIFYYYCPPVDFHWRVRHALETRTNVGKLYRLKRIKNALLNTAISSSKVTAFSALILPGTAVGLTETYTCQTSPTVIC